MQLEGSTIQKKPEEGVPFPLKENEYKVICFN
jgi:hypothetical protein